MRVTAAAARRILRRQGMPSREIRAVLAANDPLSVRRLLELHRERLEEWLEEQQRLVTSIERSLAGEDSVRILALEHHPSVD
jgi:DNA-binding transcriptional MerR regulator